MLHDSRLGRAVSINRRGLSHYVVRIMSRQGSNENKGSSMVVLAHNLMGDTGSAARTVEITRWSWSILLRWHPDRR